MKRFLLVYNGPAPAAPPSHEDWPEWFDRIGDAGVLALIADHPFVLLGSAYTIEAFEVPRT